MSYCQHHELLPYHVEFINNISLDLNLYQVLVDQSISTRFLQVNLQFCKILTSILYKTHFVLLFSLIIFNHYIQKVFYTDHL